MKKVLKIFIVFAFTALALAALLFTAAQLLEPRISKLFVEKVNHNLNTTMEVGSINFTLLRNFPNATIDLRELVIHNPESFDNLQFDVEGNDDLLIAGHLFVSLKITALIRKKYIVDRVSIENGLVTILEDGHGKSNLNIFRQSENSDSAGISLDLRDLKINNTLVKYISKSRGAELAVFVSSAVNRLSLSPAMNSVDINTSFNIRTLKVNDFTLRPYTEKIKASASLLFNDMLFSCSKLSLSLANSTFDGSVTIDRAKKELSASYTSDAFPLKELSYLAGIPGSVHADNYSFSGSVASSGKIEGSFSDKNVPPAEIQFMLKNGSFRMPSIELSLENIKASGNIRLDPDNVKNTLSISVDDYSLQTDNSSLTGTGLFMNPEHPFLDISGTGDVEVSEITPFFESLPFTARGMTHANIRLSGLLPGNKKFEAADLLKLNRSLNLALKSVELTAPEQSLTFKNLKGNIMVAEKLWFDGISYTINKSRVAMNGRISGFQPWLENKKGDISITAGIWADYFNPDILFNNTSQQVKKGDDSAESSFSDQEISFNLDVKLDSLVIKTFRSAMFRGNFSYSSDLLNITSFSLNTMGGSFSGNAAVALLSPDKYIGKGVFDLDNVDINEAFTVFNNFGQDYIKAENLKGSLTGKISVTSLFGNKFIPDPGSIQASGNYIIRNGELVSFEPVYELSKFVELSELKEIKFSELRNDLIIRDRVVHIPEMDIMSTAFNINLSGNYSFDGVYDYHLKILLSDLLSRKARQNNSDINEFGVIENDGLGKTALYLKITGDKNDNRIAYDVKNLGATIKKDIKEEKSNLKTILKEEYGWYAHDSIPTGSRDETKKFSIIWEEADSVRTTEPETNEKILPLRNILKKKKKHDG